MSETVSRGNLAPNRPSWRATFFGSDGAEGKANISWGSIFAGAVVAIAVLITLSLIGVAIGMGTVSPTSDQPFDGLGTGMAIWAVVSLLLALGAGGFTSGVFAGRAGFMQGFMTWAPTLIAAVVMIAMGIGAAFGLAGSVLSSAGRAAGGVASVAGDAVSAATRTVTDQLEKVDVDNIDVSGEDVEKILTDTGVEELQPGYLRGQVDEMKSEVTEAGKVVLADPQKLDQEIDKLSSSFQDRAEHIADSVDRDAVARSVEKNTDLTGEEADQLVDRIVEASQATARAASEQIDRADQAIQDAKPKIDDTIQQARQTADDASNATAKGAVWAFVGVLVGLIVTSFADLAGSRIVVGRDAATGEVKRGL